MQRTVDGLASPDLDDRVAAWQAALQDPRIQPAGGLPGWPSQAGTRAARSARPVRERLPDPGYVVRGQVVLCELRVGHAVKFLASLREVSFFKTRVTAQGKTDQLVGCVLPQRLGRVDVIADLDPARFSELAAGRPSG